MQIVIIAGGMATRLGEITEKIPKSMIEICKKPFIYWQLKILKNNGINDVVLCLGHYADQIMDYIGDGSKFGMNVKYSLDGEKKIGTGGAIKKALHLLEDRFFVMYGDSFLDINYNNIGVFDGIYWPMRNYNETGEMKNRLGLMTVFKNYDNFDNSNVEYDDYTILKYSKNEKTDRMNYIDYGLGILDKKCFENIDEQSFDLSKIYSSLAEIGQLSGYEVNKRFFEIGSVDGIKDTQEYIKIKYGG